MVLKYLGLRNFKSVGNAEVGFDFAPLTVLVGPNGAGKTSVLDAIGLLVQSANRPRQSGLVLDGNYLRVESEDLLFHKRQTQTPFEIKLSVSPKQFGVDAWWNPHPQNATLTFELAYRWAGTRATGEVEITQQLSFDGVPQVRVAQLRDQRTFELLTPGLQYTGTPIDADHLLGRRAFGQIAGGAQPTPETVLQFARSIGDTVDQLATALGATIISLSSTRGADLYVREVGDITISTGRFGEGTIRVLSALQADVAKREGVDLMRFWCNRFGLDNITAGWVGRNELQLQFTDPSTGTALPIGAAGSGSQHLLPFIVNCFASAQPRVLLADELEQGLHPQFQIELAHLLAEVVNRGNQVVLCTQSPTLVLAICASVAQARLKADQVAIYSLDRAESGETRAARNQVSVHGAVVGGWFEHYARAERQLLDEYLPRAEE